MTDDVLRQLTAAGDLLEQDGRAAVADCISTATSYPGSVESITPTDSTRRWPWLAAAVVVIAAGGWFVLSRSDGALQVSTIDLATDGLDAPGTGLDQTVEPTQTLEPDDGGTTPEPEPTTGAVSPSTVALIPRAGTSGWEAVNGASIGVSVDHGDQVVVTPSGSGVMPERTVAVRRESEQGPVGGLTPVSGSGLTGFWRTDSGRGRAELVVTPPAGSTHGLTMWTGQTLTVEELFDIAARFDLSRPLPGQTIGDGWQVINDGGAEGVVHNFQLVQGMEGPERRWLWGTTHTRMGPGAEWMIDEPYLGTATVVRGRPGVLIAEPDGHMATVVWVEAPGVVVQLTWGRLDASFDERVQGVLDAAADLVPVDAAEWAAFTAEVVPWP